MDPNECLNRIRALVLTFRESDDSEGSALAEHIEALDGWLSSGGFLPQAWERAQ